MYVVVVDGEREQVLDLSGVYRLIARCNPLDTTPMSLDAKAVTLQMTCPKEDCLLAVSTREALHALVWGAAAGKVTSYRFSDGVTVALKVLPGSEYKQPPREYGEVKSPASIAPAAGSSDGSRRYGVGGRR